MYFDETNKAIVDIETRVKAISQASENEQKNIIDKIYDEYRKIGEASYKLYSERSFELGKIVPMLKAVEGLHQVLKDKKTKLFEIQSRYDEELSILKSAQPYVQKEPDTPTQQQVQSKPVTPIKKSICSSCGAAYTLGESHFCRKCGNDVSGKISESEIDNGSISTSQVSMCGLCNAALLPEALFCSLCGQKT